MNRVSQPPRSPFLALFLLEMRRGMGRLAFIAAVMILADLYFLEVLVAGTGLVVLPVFSLPALAILLGFDALRNEWREQTHYILLSLPVPGRTLVGAKLMAVGVQLLILALVAAGVAWWHLGFRVPFPGSPDWRLGGVAARMPLWVQSLLAASAFLPLMNLAAAGLLVFVAGQTVGRGRWLYVGVAVGALLWGAFHWGAFHLAEPIWSLAGLLPDVDFSHVAGTPMECRTALKPVCTFDLGWPAMNLVGLAVLTWAAVALWDRKAEV